MAGVRPAMVLRQRGLCCQSLVSAMQGVPLRIPLSLSPSVDTSVDTSIRPVLDT